MTVAGLLAMLAGVAWAGDPIVVPARGAGVELRVTAGASLTRAASASRGGDRIVVDLGLIDNAPFDANGVRKERIAAGEGVFHVVPLTVEVARSKALRTGPSVGEASGRASRVAGFRFERRVDLYASMPSGLTGEVRLGPAGGVDGVSGVALGALPVLVAADVPIGSTIPLELAFFASDREQGSIDLEIDLQAR